jgi:hypothetical protein
MQDTSQQSELASKTLWALYSLIIVITLSLVGVYLISSSNDKSSKTNSKNENQSVLSQTTSTQVQINVQEKNYSINFQDGESVFDALKRLQSKDSNFKFEYKQYDFGFMISSMNGETPDSSHFWKFQVNGADSAVGISDYKVKEGDKITFVMDVIQF